MIWTEEEKSDRAIETMLNPKGKSCFNCNWGEGSINPEDKRSDWTTCGHHHQNFSVKSLCSYWTNPKDPRLKEYRERRREEIRIKYSTNDPK